MMLAYLAEYNRYLNLVGIAFIMGIAWLFSAHRKQIDKRLVCNALILQFVIAFVALKTSFGYAFLKTAAGGINALYEYAQHGISFLFGKLALSAEMPWGAVFAIQVLPIIIFFGAFMALLFHVGIIQRVVTALGYVIRPVLGTTGPETLCAIANSFLGQTEAPLVIKNYLTRMTKSEFLVVMVSGMGTVSGALLALYGKFGAPLCHLLAASVMAIPATIMIAKILLPETERSATLQKVEAVSAEACAKAEGNVFDAISTGTSDGLHLALNVGAMLVAFISLIALLNGCLGGVTGLINNGCGTAFSPLSLGTIFSWIFSPFGYLMGLTGTDAVQVGKLIGTKVAINEFVAYLDLVNMDLSPRAVALATYALCGFSNFSCIGIQIGGIGALVPEKRKWLTQLGLIAVLGGTLSNLLTAMVAGLFI